MKSGPPQEMIRHLGSCWMMARRAENKMRFQGSGLNQVIAVRRTGLAQRARVEKTISARCLEQGQMVLHPRASWHRMLLRKDSET